jgi:hypothetical protein
MKTDLGTGYAIEGFDSHEIVKWNELGYYLKYLVKHSRNDKRTLVYWGKTSKIPEDIAKECVVIIELNNHSFYQEYNLSEKAIKHPSITARIVPTAKESILSACPNPYCIIYKQK